MMVSNTLFITGTDTSAGKTYVCARLLEFLKNKGITAGYQKWVATGVQAGMPEDLTVCAAAAGITPAPALTAQQVPYRFEFPASPHLAAELENRTVDPEVIIENYKKLAASNDWLIVEGVGGLMVPLRRDLLLADLLARLRPLTLVVARSGLGTLNHTLLTLEALRHRQIPILGVLFSDSGPEENQTLVLDNMQTIGDLGRVRVLGRLPWQQQTESARREFIPVGQAIFAELFREK